MGWSPHCAKALTTAADKGSGGCAVVTRKGIGITGAGEDLIANAFTHRVAAAQVNAKTRQYAVRLPELAGQGVGHRPSCGPPGGGHTMAPRRWWWR